jgi:hypothetical protein
VIQQALAELVDAKTEQPHRHYTGASVSLPDMATEPALEVRPLSPTEVEAAQTARLTQRRRDGAVANARF